MATDNVQEQTEAGDGVLEKQRYDELTIKNAKMVRKRTGRHGGRRNWRSLSKGISKGCVICQRVPLPREAWNWSYTPCLEMIWRWMFGALSWTAMTQLKILKDAANHKRKKEKQRRSKGDKGQRLRYKRCHLDNSESDDSSISLSDSSTSSSSDGSCKRETKQSVSSSTWSPAKPPMVIVDGKEHFRGKTSNN